MRKFQQLIPPGRNAKHAPHLYYGLLAIRPSWLQAVAMVGALLCSGCSQVTAVLQICNSNPALQHYRPWACLSSTVTPLMLFSCIVKMHRIVSLTNFHLLQPWLPEPLGEQQNCLELQKGEAGVPDQKGLEKGKCLVLHFFMSLWRAAVCE